MKAMAVDPADRYQSVLELRREIFACIDGYPTQDEKKSQLRLMELYVKRHWSTIAISVLLILVGVLAVLLFIYKKI